MTPTEYQTLAARTIPDGMSRLDMGRHAAMGLVAELNELEFAEMELGIASKHRDEDGADEAIDEALDHIKKELGDMWWFLAELFTANQTALLDAKRPQWSSEWEPDVDKQLAEICGAYQKTYQGHEVKPLLIIETLLRLYDYLTWITVKQWGFDVEYIWQLNIAKLKARYPDGFDVEHSLHRAEGDI